MARLSFLFFILFLHIALTATRCRGKSQLPEKHARAAVPFFLFGDSFLDVGNNNYINTSTLDQANFWPYGETYFKFPTGRFSDGRLVSDFIGEICKIFSCGFYCLYKVQIWLTNKYSLCLTSSSCLTFVYIFYLCFFYFVAKHANLPLIPPFLQPGFRQYYLGVNFASAGAGALAETFQGFVCIIFFLPISSFFIYIPEYLYITGMKLSTAFSHLGMFFFC